MAGRVNALDLLREFVSQKRPIVEMPDSLQFGEVMVPRKKMTRARDGEGKPLSVEVLYVLAKCAGVSYVQYRTECLALGIAAVSFKDRAPLLQYLTGQVDSVPHVEHEEEEQAEVAEKEVAPRVLLDALPVLGAELLEARHAHAQRLRHATASAPAPAPELSADVLQRIRAKRLAAPKKKEGEQSTGLDDLELDLAQGGDGSQLPHQRWLALTASLVEQLHALEQPSLPLSAALHAPGGRFEGLAGQVAELLKREEAEQRVQARTTYDEERNKRKAQLGTTLAQHQAEAVYKERGIGFDLQSFDPTQSFLSASAEPRPAPAPAPAPAAMPSPARKRKAEEAAPTPGKRARVEPAQPPIVLVPGAPVTGSLLSMLNVPQWLSKQRLEPVAPEQRTKTQRLLLDRPDGKGAVELVGDAKLLRPEDWARVVAAFVHGAAWQFKGWKWEQPAELFGKVKGFYVRYEDERAPPALKQWNVKELTVSRHAHHADAKAAAMFWADVDEALRIRALGAH